MCWWMPNSKIAAEDCSLANHNPILTSSHHVALSLCPIAMQHTQGGTLARNPLLMLFSYDHADHCGNRADHDSRLLLCYCLCDSLSFEPKLCRLLTAASTIVILERAFSSHITVTRTPVTEWRSQDHRGRSTTQVNSKQAVCQEPQLTRDSTFRLFMYASATTPIGPF